MYDPALQEHFHFDDADLVANRNGALTEKQKQKLIRDNKSSKTFGIGCGIGALVFFLAIASIFPIVFIPLGLHTMQEGDMGGAIGSFIAAGVWALVWGGIGVGAAFFGLTSGTADRSKVILKKVVGPINIVGVQRESGGEHPHTYIDHELHIGHEQFDVDENVAGMMMQGDLYAFYFIQNMDGTGKSIMSLERLSHN
jgi:hypothetical protein